jgi:ABC-type transport system involved in multi-copper enzyme maturation permease subunit
MAAAFTRKDSLMSAFLRAVGACLGGGPVLTYDLVRSARRTRFVVVRTLYALLLAFVLGWVFLLISFKFNGHVPTQRMAEMAAGCFYALLGIQFGMVVLLTPAYTAGAIAEEKERRTLEFILATDLRNGEIISGKVTSRLVNLALLLLAGVPIFSLLQFLGGVDFTLVLAGFAATALTMFSLAGLSILHSVGCRRARHAIVLTYLTALAYFFISGGAWLAKLALTAKRIWPGLVSFPSMAGWTSPVELGDLVDWLSAGNVGCAVWKLGRGASATAVLDRDLPGVLGGYALFHGLAGLACLGWAALRLRAVALREDVQRSPKVKGAEGGAGRSRSVGRHPMIWKEVFAEGGLRLNRLGKVVVGLLFVASFSPVAFYLWEYFRPRFFSYAGGWERLSRHINAAQARGVGTTLAVLMLLAVVVRAAGSVRGERERNTFDDLLTTPLSNNEILFGKWLGAVLSVRWGWAWLGLIWLVCLLTGSVEVFGLPLILISWLVTATVGAGVGLWFSIGSTSTLRATVAALATTIFLCGGHWLVTGLFCYLPLAVLVRGADVDPLLALQAGQSPPFVMGFFAFHGQDLEHVNGRKVMVVVASLFGIVCWAGGLVPLLWLLVKRRFEQVTGRSAQSRPEGAAPRPRPAAKRIEVKGSYPCP